jgi:UDP-glucose 4-epimerase
MANPGESYNIGTGVSATFNHIYGIIREEMSSLLEARNVPNPLKNYQCFMQTDMTKTRRDLEFMPEYDLRTGIRSML